MNTLWHIRDCPAWVYCCFVRAGCVVSTSAEVVSINYAIREDQQIVELHELDPDTMIQQTAIFEVERRPTGSQWLSFVRTKLSHLLPVSEEES